MKKTFKNLYELIERFYLDLARKGNLPYTADDVDEGLRIKMKEHVSPLLKEDHVVVPVKDLAAIERLAKGIFDQMYKNHPRRPISVRDNYVAKDAESISSLCNRNMSVCSEHTEAKKIQENEPRTTSYSEPVPDLEITYCDSKNPQVFSVVFEKDSDMHCLFIGKESLASLRPQQIKGLGLSENDSLWFDNPKTGEQYVVIKAAPDDNEPQDPSSKIQEIYNRINRIERSMKNFTTQVASDYSNIRTKLQGISNRVQEIEIILDDDHSC